MYINLKEFYYEKLHYYAIKNNSYNSFKKNKKSIKEAINKIVDDNNEYLLTESFICYLANKDIGINLNTLSSNDKYGIYELLSLYYQELIQYFYFSTPQNRLCIKENDLTKYLDIETIDVLSKIDLMFIKMGRLNDINIYYSSLMKLTVYYIVAYCQINDCMNSFDNLISYYQDDFYKIQDEIVIYGIDIMDTNNELIDRISSGITNKKKKEIN